VTIRTAIRVRNRHGCRKRTALYLGTFRSIERLERHCIGRCLSVGPVSGGHIGKPICKPPELTGHLGMHLCNATLDVGRLGQFRYDTTRTTERFGFHLSVSTRYGSPRIGIDAWPIIFDGCFGRSRYDGAMWRSPTILIGNRPTRLRQSFGRCLNDLPRHWVRRSSTAGWSGAEHEHFGFRLFRRSPSP